MYLFHLNVICKFNEKYIIKKLFIYYLSGMGFCINRVIFKMNNFGKKKHFQIKLLKIILHTYEQNIISNQL